MTKKNTQIKVVIYNHRQLSIAIASFEYVRPIGTRLGDNFGEMLSQVIMTSLIGLVTTVINLSYPCYNHFLVL